MLYTVHFFFFIKAKSDVSEDHPELQTRTTRFLKRFSLSRLTYMPVILVSLIIRMTYNADLQRNSRISHPSPSPLVSLQGLLHVVHHPPVPALLLHHANCSRNGIDKTESIFCRITYCISLHSLGNTATG